MTHGTRTGYVYHGCRCQQCTTANTEGQREYLRRNPPAVKGKPAHWHVLSQIDPEMRTAVCSICGPARIRRSNDRGHGWRCARRRSRPSAPGYRKHCGPACERCGFEPEDPCQLDVHHLDGDRANNAGENLQTLCANCHRLVTAMELRGLPVPAPL